MAGWTAARSLAFSPSSRMPGPRKGRKGEGERSGWGFQIAPREREKATNERKKERRRRRAYALRTGSRRDAWLECVLVIQETRIYDIKRFLKELWCYFKQRERLTPLKGGSSDSPCVMCRAGTKTKQIEREKRDHFLFLFLPLSATFFSPQCES